MHPQAGRWRLMNGGETFRMMCCGKLGTGSLCSGYRCGICSGFRARRALYVVAAVQTPHPDRDVHATALCFGASPGRTCAPPLLRRSGPGPALLFIGGHGAPCVQRPRGARHDDVQPRVRLVYCGTARTRVERADEGPARIQRRVHVGGRVTSSAARTSPHSATSSRRHDVQSPECTQDLRCTRRLSIQASQMLDTGSGYSTQST